MAFHRRSVRQKSSLLLLRPGGITIVQRLYCLDRENMSESSSYSKLHWITMLQRGYLALKSKPDRPVPPIVVANLL